MSRQRFFVGLILVACVAAVYLLMRSGHAGYGETDSEEQVPTVVSVQTGLLKRATLHGYVDGYARVEAAPAEGGQPAAMANVASPVAGVLQTTEVAEGQAVKQGQLLFMLDDRAARVALDRAQDALRYAQQEADRQKKLLEQQNASTRSVQEAEAQVAAAQGDVAAARTQLDLLHITAPLSGMVTRIDVKPGEAVDLTTVLAEITDTHRLVVSADIPSADAAALEAGQAVTVEGANAPQTKLSFVSPTIDVTNGTVRVRAHLPADTTLRPGAFVRLRIVTATHANVLAAPAESVVTDDQGRSVIALVSGDQATQVSVRTGLHDGDLIEVEGPGLKEGDTVVTVGAYGLPEKTTIQVTP